MGTFYERMKKALITGITGQDGSYLAELLLAKGYEVHGIIRRASTFNTSRIDHLYSDPHVNGVRLFLHYGDLADSVQMVKLLYELQPDEIYNLGAQSHVRVSFDIPEYTGDVDGLGAQRILEAIREAGLVKKVRYYQASSSEMFGKVQQVPQTESTPFWPRSPYGCAKAYAYYLTVNYRESYNMHASNGILFNHESPAPRRDLRHAQDHPRGDPDQGGPAGVALPRQPRRAAGLGLREGVRRDDVAHAPAGPARRLRRRDERDPQRPGLLRGRRSASLGLDWEKYVRHDARYERPAEVDLLIGDPAKAARQLGWKPKVRFKELVKIMVDHDLDLAKRESQIAKLPNP